MIGFREIGVEEMGDASERKRGVEVAEAAPTPTPEKGERMSFFRDKIFGDN